MRRDISVQHNERDHEQEISQANYPYKQYERDDEFSQTNGEVEKSKKSIKRDTVRKREEIKNSTIGGF